MSDMTFLHYYLDKNGITQTKLAEDSGIPRSTICLYANGKRFPRGNNAKRICEALGLPEEYARKLSSNWDEVAEITEENWDDSLSVYNQESVEVFISTIIASATELGLSILEVYKATLALSEVSKQLMLKKIDDVHIEAAQRLIDEGW